MGRKTGLTIGKVRSALYTSGKYLGDMNAVVRGTIGQRITSRVLGALSAQFISAIVRALFGRR